MNTEDRFDDEIMRDAAKLATEIAPERDLWPGIEASIAAPAPARRGFVPYFAQAAAVLLLVGGSSAITWMVAKHESSPVVPEMPMAGTIEFDAEFASFGDNYNLGPGFTDARINLEAELAFELERLSPEARTTVEENLQIIRTAISDINKELAEDPDNELLQDLLIQSYREELAVMREVGVLTRDVMSRNDI